MGMPDSLLDFYQGEVSLVRKFLCYMACSQLDPFRPDRNLLEMYHVKY